MKKLTSMTDFVLKYSDVNSKEYKHANFLKQPLELWMFVPCSPSGQPYTDLTRTDIFFKQAKERCLFEGFEVLEYNYLPDDKSIAIAGILTVFWYNKKTGWKLASGIYNIEDLVKYNLKLTPTAIKQIGL